MDIKIEGFTIESSQYYQQVINIRNDVFVDELGFDKHLEFDGVDETATHYIVLFNGQPAGCSRWVQKNSEIVIDRFCVSREFRNRGLAVLLIKFIIRELLPSKKDILIYSVTDSIVFFTQSGFKDTGSPINYGSKSLNVLKFVNG